MRHLYLATLLGLFISCRSPQPLFTVSDRCAEGTFTQNCEGPQCDRAGNLYVVNFQKNGTVGVLRPGAPPALFVELPSGSTANSIRFDSRGDMLLADFTGHNILRVNMKTRAVTVFCHDDRFHQPNDLAVSSTDVVYASDPKWANGTGQLWMIAPDGQATLLEANMGTTNGIELSPDGRTLYVNESVQRNIWAYDVLPDGRLAGKRLLHHFEAHGLDGMKCSPSGNLYVARWGSGTVAVLSPTGQLLREIPTKGKKVSNLAFGGKDGRTVYVTLQDRGCVETFRRNDEL